MVLGGGHNGGAKPLFSCARLANRPFATGPGRHNLQLLPRRAQLHYDAPPRVQARPDAPMGTVLEREPLWPYRVERAMIATLTAMLIVLATTPISASAAKLLAVPSGQVLVPYEALWEDRLHNGETAETWLILRFLAPDIARKGGRITFDDAEADLGFLCETVGIPLARSTGGGVDQIVVTLLDRPLPRGERNPDVTQFGNAYRIVDNACQWEF